jgi:lysophospholipase L1-like esterase
MESWSVTRYGPDVRWGSVVRSNLGAGYWVVEEGLGGRTTNCDDPEEGAHKNGERYLLPCLESHAPLDMVIIMLGTNDLKQRFQRSAAEIAAGAGQLIDVVQQSSSGPGGAAPKVLLICPPPIARLRLFAEMFAGASQTSRELAACYQHEAQTHGCAFLDAGQIITSSNRDGIHLEAEAHVTLGQAVAWMIRQGRI